MSAFLIVRLGSLGDIVHALPAAAALREAFPDARIDWLVDARHRALLELVPIIDRPIVLPAPTPAGWFAAIRNLRRGRYDAAIDLQGLLKSAVLARTAGARRTIGFATPHLREGSAGFFYTDAVDPGEGLHVIRKNLRLLPLLGIDANAPYTFPLVETVSPALEAVRARLTGHARFALLNPGAAWPNKRWPPDRFGGVARTLRDRFGLPSVVLWGPDEETLARDVVAASGGAAEAAPRTTIADLVELSRVADLMVCGDTGPLHIAAAVGTPIVGIYGPTSPSRNGPWSPNDVSLSRFETCICHHQRRCRSSSWCLRDVQVEDVIAAVGERLARARATQPSAGSREVR